jgi:uncharacterized phage protein gp47/JayE
VLPNKPELEEIITEILENVVYGWQPVYDEQVVFASGTYFYDLESGDQTVKNIYDLLYVDGTLGGTEYTFIENNDYQLYDSTGDGKFDQFRWLNTGDNPDAGTTFYVSYRYQITPTGLTDVTPGSVLRTMVEAYSIQLYRAFLKLEEVGRDSFIDTAVGRNLDLLGRIVSITRNEATRATGFITLQRDPTNTTSNLDIPIGIRFATIETTTTPSVLFQTTKSARIRSGEVNAVTYTTPADPDHLEGWVAIEAVEAGLSGNVSSGAIVRNITAQPQVIYVYNDSSYDKSGEQFTGDGESQVYELSHVPSSVATQGIRYIQYMNGYLEQPSSADVVRLELTDVTGTGYNSGGSVTCTVYGLDQTSAPASEAETLSEDGTPNATTTTQFSRVDYITFTNSDDPSEGVGEGIGANYKVTVGQYSGGWTEKFIDDQAVGTRADSGWLDMIADEDYIDLYIWYNNSWTLVAEGATGPATDYFAYTDTDDDAGRVMWNDGLGGGSTWDWTSPYITQYDAGPNSDGQNIKIEYYPASGETGTGEATAQSTGITAITVTEEYKYGWLNQPSSAGSNISASFTDGAAGDQNWSGTVVINGTTTTGGDGDEEALTFSAEDEQTTTKKFSKITYVSWSNSDNPSEGPGEGSASGTSARIGTTTKGEDIMDEQECGTRVDGGWLSLVGVDSDNTLKVYVWDNGWGIRDQVSSHYIYTDEGDTAGLVDWDTTWDWSTSPYVNAHDAGPFGDGRNIKIEYVPAYDQYSTNDEQLLLEGIPTLNSTLTVSYTLSNLFNDGTNTEVDSAFKVRIKSAISAAAKGTLAAIEAAVLAVSGIEGVVVDDHSTDPTIDIGEVHVFAWTGSGLLDAGTRSLVSDAVNDTRAAGVKPVVQSPIPIYLAVQVTVKVDKLSTSSLSTVETNVESAIESFIDGLGINQVVYKTALIEAIEADVDVKYISLDTLVVYGYDTDQSTAVSQEAPYASSPYWGFAEAADASHQLWSSNGNIIFVNSGYVLRPDTEGTGTGNEEIEVTAEYE